MHLGMSVWKYVLENIRGYMEDVDNIWIAQLIWTARELLLMESGKVYDKDRNTPFKEDYVPTINPPLELSLIHI